MSGKRAKFICAVKLSETHFFSPKLSLKDMDASTRPQVRTDGVEARVESPDWNNNFIVGHIKDQLCNTRSSSGIRL